MTDRFAVLFKGIEQIIECRLHTPFQATATKEVVPAVS